MKKYEFHCGGDHGAWECYVTVPLTEEEESILKAYSESTDDEFLYWDKPLDKVYSKVLKALDEQCDDLDAESVVIWVPTGMRVIK